MPRNEQKEEERPVKQAAQSCAPVQIAVIGYGGMGSWHAAQLEEMPQFAVRGVYDIREERNALAREKGFHAYASLEELLVDTQLELVTIATPNDLHKELAIAAMRAGKAVVCEKPVALNSGELEEMIAVSHETGRLFTVHQNRRWDPDYLTMKRVFDEGTLGRTFRVESKVHGSRGVPGDWRNTREHGGGMVLDWGIHLLDQALMMAEHYRLRSVYASLDHITNDEVDDGLRVILKFEPELEILVEVGTSNFIELQRWYMLGENGSAILRSWEPEDGEIVMVSDWENRDAVPVQAGVGLTKTMAPRTEDTIKRYPLPAVHAEWSQFYENIYDVLRNGAAQLITHEQLRRSMRLMEAIFRSAEGNQVVKDPLGAVV